MLASGAKVGADYAIVFAVVGADEVQRAVAFLAAVRGDGAGLDDDSLRLGIARAALAADDAEFLYPGDVLMSRARQRLGAGTALARPPVGRATECSALTPAVLRQRLAETTPLRVAALGVVDKAWLAAVSGMKWSKAACPARGLATCGEVGAQPQMTTDLSARSDSPYLGVAFGAPAGAQRATFALGVEVAKMRAFRGLKLRGRELFARAPFVRWSWLQADPIILFCRRGEDHVRLLPGQRQGASISDEVAATRRELAALLADLRGKPPTTTELEGARAALLGQLVLPGPEEQPAWASEPATLPGRVQVLLLRAHHDVDVEALEGVTAAQVGASLAATLALERASWHAVAPRPRDNLGYRRR